MSREILAIEGLDQTTPAFQRELIAVADRRGLDPGFLAAVIHFESRFDPAATNPRSGCVGLLQFCYPKTVGTTWEALREMTALEQLEYVERHYTLVDPAKRIRSLEDHYLAVFSPACVGFPPDAVLPCRPNLKPWARPPGGCQLPLTGAYCSNKELDLDGNGVITAFEATEPVRRRVAAAQARPPMVVDYAPPGPLPNRPPPPPVPEKATPIPLEIAKVAPLTYVAALAAGATAGFFVVRWLGRSGI